MSEKAIIAYGDSLTWGFDPDPSGMRHPPHQRWPLVLEEGLGTGARVIEAGLSGRTTCHDAGFLEYHNALSSLPLVLEQSLPVDLMIIMLGTNDLQAHIGASATNAARGVHRLIHKAKAVVAEQRIMRYPDLAMPKFLIITPPDMIAADAGIRDYFGDQIPDQDELKAAYQNVALLADATVFHAGDHCQPSALDGVHLTGEETAKLGRALVPVVADILKINLPIGGASNG
ncbi:MAG: GDSL-type esterase/lipase family protein [Pseudomonadota bacterium]